MKKVMQRLMKKKKKKVSQSCDEVTADAVPEPSRNLPSCVVKASELYNNFRVDDCKLARGRGQLGSVGSEIEESMRVDDFRENSLDVNAIPIPDDGSSSMGESSSEDADISLSPSPDPTENQVEAMNESSSENPLIAIPRADHVASNKSCVRDDNRNKPDRGGNKYVINISNSKHFHIGSQKTFNYSGGIDGSLTKNQVVNVSNQKIMAASGNHLLDIKEKLSDDDVLRISLSIRDKWREFARNLGVDESVIRESEISNDGDSNLIVHDLLQRYLRQYPSTTLGYVIGILKKSGEEDAIAKLMEGS